MSIEKEKPSRFVSEHFIVRKADKPHEYWPKLNGQIALTKVCDFIPKIISSPSDLEAEFKMQRLSGPEWDVLRSDLEVPFSAHLVIAMTAVRQMQELLEKYRVVLIDRHLGNVMLDKTTDQTSLYFKGSYWRIYQIDPGLLYDLQEDVYELSSDVDLVGRINRSEIKDEKNANYVIANVVRTLLGDVLGVLISFRKQGRLDEKLANIFNRLLKTYETWDEYWSTGQYKLMTFEVLLNELNAVVE